MAGLIAPSTLEQIRAANDIVDVVGSYFPLKRAGANFVALCPFHKEKTPSFHVNPHRQIFHCFGCQKGGDVFTFVQEYENLPFIEAVQRLAERARIPLERETQSGQTQTKHLKQRLLEIHEEITRRWHSCLLHEAAGQAARDYLARRRVPEEAVKRFRLGCAPDAWDDTVNWAKGKGYDAALMEKCGLILRKENSEHWYDRFRGRLIFPITDEQARVIGFSGRVLAEDAKTAKYVNSPETLLFQKSKVFFGLDKARRPLLDAGVAVICEGQLDLIACHMAGFQNVVAPQGTAFTADHARILKRYVEEVVLCFDSDPAGQSAAVRAIDHLLAVGLPARVAVLPSPHDPDSFLRECGADAFAQRLKEAPGFFDFYLDRLCTEHDPASDKGRLAILKAMAEIVLKTQNQVLIDVYSQKTAQRLGVASDAVRTEFRKFSRTQSAPSPHPDETEPAAPASPSPSSPELWLLRILLLHDELVDWISHHLDLQWLEHAQVRALVAGRLSAHTNQTWAGLAALLHQIDDPTARQLITEVASDQRHIPDPERTLKGDPARKGLLEIIRNDFLDRQLSALQREATRPDLQPADIARIETAKANLRQMKRQPLAQPPS
jgi:DNA primase